MAASGAMRLTCPGWTRAAAVRWTMGACAAAAPLPSSSQRPAAEPLPWPPGPWRQSFGSRLNPGNEPRKETRSPFLTTWTDGEGTGLRRLHSPWELRSNPACQPLVHVSSNQALTLHGWYRYNSQLLGQTPKQCEKKSVDYRHVLQQGEKERDHSLQKLRALSIGRTDKKLRCPVP
ncbi:uncharacterized protein LOC144457771 isoform X1 [Phascolarctos cinereus]